MSRTQCPKCNGTGSVLSHLNPHDVNKVGAGASMHRCDRCAGQGFIHGAGGSPGVFGGGAGGSFGERVGNLVMFIFAIFFAMVLGDVQPFGLNWVVSALIGLFVGAVVAGFLLATRIGRYILWALGIGFVVAVAIAMMLDK